MEGLIYLNDGTSVYFFPVDSFQGCLPTDDDKLEMYLTPILEEGYAPGKDNLVIEFTLTEDNKHKEVMLAIADALVFPETPIVTLFDSVSSVKVSEYISSFTGTASTDP